MVDIEPVENPSRTLTWKPLVFLSHINRRTNDDRFSVSQWDSFFFSNLGVSTPVLIGPPQQTQLSSFLGQWTLKDTCMTILYVFSSSILTVKYLVWIISCRRNQISFVSPFQCLHFQPFFSFFWKKFYFYITCENSSHTVFSSFPRTFSSVFFVSSTWWEFILVFHWLLYSS